MNLKLLADGSAIFKFPAILLRLGIMAGLSSALFLYSLEWVSDFFLSHPQLIWTSPLMGILSIWLYKRYAHGSEKGFNLILDSIHNEHKAIPKTMAPLIYVATLLAHICGGSVGREGTAVQMSASLSEWSHSKNKLDVADKKRVLIYAIAAGFAGVFGTPFAAAIFALEVTQQKQNRLREFITCYLVAGLAHLTCQLTGIRHHQPAIVHFPQLSLNNLLLLIAIALAFALTARFFVYLSKLIHTISSQAPNTYVAIASGAFLLITIYTLWPYHEAFGLGSLPIIDNFTAPARISLFFEKLGLTALTLGCGFKGGEVTPLFFMGSALGSSLSAWTPLSTDFLAGAGYVIVFAAAANVPLTGAALAAEIFGFHSMLWITPLCFLSYYFSGAHSIYHAHTPNKNQPASPQNNQESIEEIDL